jgi:hypothetical protein
MSSATCRSRLACLLDDLVEPPQIVARQIEGKAGEQQGRRAPALASLEQAQRRARVAYWTRF